ncbi:MAG: GNAT family N-acetyltransferase [Acidimicrobiia bacterium]
MANRQQINVSPAPDEDRAIATIAMAFCNDPVTRWVFRDAHLYLTYWPRVVKAFGGAAFAQGTADSIDDCGGVALWLPPDVRPDTEKMGALVAEAVPAADQEEVFGFMGEMDEFHPTEPHWYLPLIGVDVTRQGRGYGSALLRHALERCDRDRLPAYLEASSPRNKPLYEHHGFQELGVIQEGSSPPMWPMQRVPREPSL